MTLKSLNGCEIIVIKKALIKLSFHGGKSKEKQPEAFSVVSLNSLRIAARHSEVQTNQSPAFPFYSFILKHGMCYGKGKLPQNAGENLILSILRIPNGKKCGGCNPIKGASNL